MRRRTTTVIVAAQKGVEPINFDKSYETSTRTLTYVALVSLVGFDSFLNNRKVLHTFAHQVYRFVCN